MNTDAKLSRISAICNDVAATGKPIRTVDQGRVVAKTFLGTKKKK